MTIVSDGGAALANINGSGLVDTFEIPTGSTIIITTPRGSGDVLQAGSDQNATDAGASVITILQQDGVA